MSSLSSEHAQARQAADSPQRTLVDMRGQRLRRGATPPEQRHLRHVDGRQTGGDDSPVFPQMIPTLWRARVTPT